jgi:hypothetical protein
MGKKISFFRQSFMILILTVPYPFSDLIFLRRDPDFDDPTGIDNYTPMQVQSGAL